MNRPARSPRGTDLAKIHIAAQQLGLRGHNDDSAYRDMLWSIARVRSAKDLDAQGRAAVLAHLRKCGFQDGSSKTGQRYTRGTKAALIRWLWTELANEGAVQDRSDRALRRYIGQHAFPMSAPVDEIAPQHLDSRDADSVIEQLKNWLARVQAARKIAKKAGAA